MKWTVHFTNGETVDIEGEEEDVRLAANPNFAAVPVGAPRGGCVIINPSKVNYIIRKPRRL